MRKTTLIVEDNELDMKLFNDLLELGGYNTVRAADGRAALELAKRHHPDLILLDIQLPDISGIEVAEMIKAEESLKDIPVIAVTAYTLRINEKKCREGGFDAYITKPISVPDFLETVAKFIGG